jgi:hypothetical protein
VAAAPRAQHHEQQVAVAGDEMDAAHWVESAELVHYGLDMLDPSDLWRKISSGAEIADDNVLLTVDVVGFPVVECHGLDLVRAVFVHHGPGGVSGAPDERRLPYQTLQLGSNGGPVRRRERVAGEEHSAEGAQAREGDLGVGDWIPQHELRREPLVVHQGEPAEGRAAAVREAGRRIAGVQPRRAAAGEAEGAVADLHQAAPPRGAGKDPWAEHG